MDLSTAVTFAGTSHNSVLTTIRNNTLPQLSSVSHSVGEDGLVRISITSDRAKYVNLTRRPWAALHVGSADFWSYVVLEADVVLTPVAQAPDDATVEELVRIYREIRGEDHPDWDEYRQAMVDDHRVVARLTPARAYGMLR